jgi:hypothetical protein
MVLVDGRYVLDGSLNLLGTITGAARRWAAFAPGGAVAYRTATGAVEIVIPAQFLVTGSIPLSADTMQTTVGSYVGNMAVASNGRWAAIITDHGVTLLNLP